MCPRNAFVTKTFSFFFSPRVAARASAAQGLQTQTQTQTQTETDLRGADANGEKAQRTDQPG